MTLQSQAAQQAAIVRTQMRALERRIAWGVSKAEQAGASEVVAALLLSKSCAAALHSALATSAELIAAHFGDDPTIYSGGDDKPEPTPEGP
jgi:hypothetical protein